MQTRLNCKKLNPNFAATIKEGNIFFKLSNPSFRTLPYFKKLNMINQIIRLIDNGLLSDSEGFLKLDILDTLSHLINMEANFENVDYYDKQSMNLIKDSIDEIPDIIKLSFDYDLVIKEKEKSGIIINSNILNRAYKKNSKYFFESDNANVRKYSDLLIKNISKTLIEYKRKCNNPIQTEFVVLDLKKLILDLESIIISAYISYNNITLFEEDIPFTI